MTNIESICCKAKFGAKLLYQLSDSERNKMLNIIALSLVEHKNEIIEANAIDLKACAEKPSNFLDRLMLNSKRIEEMSIGVRQVAELESPVNKIIKSWERPNGLKISKMRVPLGVIAIIYEARPNVSIDCLALTLKTANGIVLRGSKDAINSNKILIKIAKTALEHNGYNSDFLQLIEDISRDGANELMTMRQYIDVIIPRGSKALIDNLVQNSLIPVLETGIGNCHVYVDRDADYNKATKIIINAKTQRTSVCNAMESLLVDRKIAKEYLPKICKALFDKNVEIVGCDETRAIVPTVGIATEEDYYTEYGALKLSIKVVSDYKEAVEHINKYSTHHSESIITENKNTADFFLNFIDSSTVYVNASTRFTDGFEFGFGAEMGISTQKMHARGPLGLEQLCSEKYIVRGDGQIRE